VSRFKHKQGSIEDSEGNKVTVRALTPGERETIAQIAKEDRNRLPYYLFSTCCLEPKLTEAQVRDEVPTELLDKACGQIMKWSLTGSELFACRIAVQFGILPSEVAGIPVQDYDLLLRYWEVEPWGAWRDNLHAAIIAREVRRPYLRKGASNDLDDFMVMDPEIRRRRRLTALIQALRESGKRTERRKQPKKV
jgi:hypothetical protein